MRHRSSERAAALEAGREFRPSLVVEGHECAVKSSIPQRRKEEAVMYVEPLGIAFAVRPWDDVRGAQ